MTYGIYFDSGIIDNDLGTYGVYGVYRYYFSNSASGSFNVPGLSAISTSEYLIGHFSPDGVGVMLNSPVGSTSSINIALSTNITGYIDIVILTKTKYCTNNYLNYGIAIWGGDGSILFNTGLYYAVLAEVFYTSNTGSDVDAGGISTTPVFFGRRFIFRIPTTIGFALYDAATNEWSFFSNNRGDDTIIFLLDFY